MNNQRLGRLTNRRDHRNVVMPSIVVADTEPRVADSRDLVVPLVVEGRSDPAQVGLAGVRAAREHHARVVAELPAVAKRLSGGDPAIPTVLA